MKKVGAIVAVLALASMGVLPPASADSYVVASGVGTKIANVPYTITTPGFYYLAQNLTIVPNGYVAITIQADDVTLDLMGFSLFGVGKTSDGIMLSGSRTNVEIRNGSLRGFSGRGIYALDASCKGLRVISLRVQNTAGTGIDLTGTENLVKGCSVIGAGDYGIRTGIGSLVTGNKVINNTSIGIRADFGSSVMGNTATSNSLGIGAAPFSLVVDNAVADNATNGINAGDNCTVTRNTAYNNSSTGITTGNYCTITNNTADGLSYGSNCTPADNTVTP